MATAAPQIGTAQSLDKNGAAKGGAPVGNRNAHRNGLYSAKPVELSRQGRKKCYEYRRELENAVLDAFEQIDVGQAGTIHTASEATRLSVGNRERHAEYRGEMTLDQQMASDREYIRLLEARDKAVQRLGLPRDRDSDSWSNLYADSPSALLPAVSDDTVADAETPADESDASDEACEG